MKNLFYALAVASLAVAGCSQTEGYRIKGTVKGAADGDTVYFLRMEGRNFVPQDTAYIKNGKFACEGKQDSVINLVVSYAKGDVQYVTDFFLENGNIRLELNEQSKAGGTANNDTYQIFKDELREKQNELQRLYNTLKADSLGDDERKAQLAKLNEKGEEMTGLVKSTIQNNLENAIGIHMLTQFYNELEYNELAEILPLVPAQYQNSPIVDHLKKLVEKAQNTAIGKPFIDFEMPAPDGKQVKLSDYIGKNKYTLIDFWASWCGPCRREIPNLVDAYAKYKAKGFGIVGVSLDFDKESWLNTTKQLNITWPQMSDLKGWQSLGADLYSVRSIPHTVLVDQNGIIIEKDLREEALQEKLAELFK